MLDLISLLQFNMRKEAKYTYDQNVNICCNFGKHSTVEH